MTCSGTSRASDRMQRDAQGVGCSRIFCLQGEFYGFNFVKCIPGMDVLVVSHRKGGEIEDITILGSEGQWALGTLYPSFFFFQNIIFYRFVFPNAL